MVSRSEGYRRGASKEGLALEVFAAFAMRKLRVRLLQISDAEENYRYGDFRSPSGATVECKGQPIDPQRYPLNFVEVFEVTGNDRHRGGFEDLADLLAMRPEQLADVQVEDRTMRSTYPLGCPDRVSVSIRSIAQSQYTAYVNYQDGGRHIYLYSRDELMHHILSECRRGFLRGAGRSNEDTFAVKVPLAEARWWRTQGNYWEFGGHGREAGFIRDVQAVLL
jgi:hypothetical protein